MYKVFIDGQEGTTGLRIFSRIAERSDLSLIVIDPEKRKDVEARLACMREADITISCLPDEASRAIVAAAENLTEGFRIIDTSTAFRTSADWVYGLPELAPQKKELINVDIKTISDKAESPKYGYQAVAESDRVSVPGCHATGFNLIAGTLIRSGITGADYPFSCVSITGYSGGGKKMINEYKEKDLLSPRQYGLTQQHKHLPEMLFVSGAETVVFNPVVSNYYSGVLVTTPLHNKLLKKQISPEGLYEVFSEYFEGRPLIKTIKPGQESEDGFLSADCMADRDDLELLFYGSGDRLVISARFDNLGKGASGAAMQCMNLMLGLPETEGLHANR